MDPVVSKIVDKNDELTFTLEHVDTRVANSLRRTVLSDIPCVVFKTFPDEANQCTILKNTSLFHNEIVKQRLSCIPIKIPLTVDLTDFELHVHVKNEETFVKVVTTEDFKIRSSTTKEYLKASSLQNIFSPKKIDKKDYYITFLRLRPKISDTIEGEELELTCKFQVGTAKESGMYNVVSKCGYVFTPDVEKSNAVWEAKAKDMVGTDEEKRMEEINWKLLDAKRYYTPDSFDFTIRGIGIYRPTEIVHLACEAIIKQLEDLHAGTDAIYTIADNDTMMANSKDYILVHGDYTIGKILEYQFYKDMFPAALQYVSFFKKHPHDDNGVLRVTFTSNETEVATMQGHMRTACDNLIHIYTQIKETEFFKKKDSSVRA